jgi:hypothetical protein
VTRRRGPHRLLLAALGSGGKGCFEGKPDTDADDSSLELEGQGQHEETLPGLREANPGVLPDLLGSLVSVRHQGHQESAAEVCEHYHQHEREDLQGEAKGASTTQLVCQKSQGRHDPDIEDHEGKYSRGPLLHLLHQDADQGGGGGHQGELWLHEPSEDVRDQSLQTELLLCEGATHVEQPK